MHYWTRDCRPIILICGAMTLSACSPQAPTTQPSVYSRQQDALKHPFDYTPGMENPDITGGGIGDFDPKAFGKDLDHVLNP